MSILRLLRRDQRVRKLHRMLRSGAYSVDAASFIRELQTSHTTRLTRRLSVRDVLIRFQSKFLHAVLQNQATRSRFVEIKVQCFSTNERLERHINKLRQYLMAEYAVPLSRAARTQAERINLVNRTLESSIELQKEITTTMGIADLFIADIDATSWAIKHIIDAMTLIQEKGKQI